MNHDMAVVLRAVLIELDKGNLDSAKDLVKTILVNAGEYRGPIIG